MARLRYFLSILPLTLLPLTMTACATTPIEPKKFTVELISFEAGSVPLPLGDMGAIYEPGYILKMRRGVLVNAPERMSFNISLMNCDDEEEFFWSWWNYEDPLDDGTAIYKTMFYNDSFDQLDMPDVFCARLRGAKRKGDGVNIGFTEVKRPTFISNKIPLQIPN